MLDGGAIRTSIPGPWGPFHVAVTMRGIVAIDWSTTEAAFEARLRRRLRAPITSATETSESDPRLAELRRAVAAIETMLAGRSVDGPLRFDLADRPAWDRHVLAEVAAIPWGRTASYGEIARRVGAPRAARAVGGAVGRNPISLLIPCHRVIAADGTLGGYGGDSWGSRASALERKRDLLRLEGVRVGPPDPDRRG
jgi:methylated-DNA-[protein]-cysteine S-methyltransferase